MRAIVLAGGPADREAGCPQQLPRPFWPLVMRSLVLRLVDQMTRTGVRAVSLCANGRTALYADRFASEPLELDELRFSQDPLPRGPAGCIKDNEAFVGEESFLVADAACWLSDDASTLVQRHRQQGNKLTAFCAPGTQMPAGIYVCEPEVMELIPPVGYFDIKEQLIPRLVQADLRVGALPLRGLTAEVVSISSYLALHHRVLVGQIESELERLPESYQQAGVDVWIAENAFVSPSARLFGPVIVGPHARIEDGAVIIGPATIGPAVLISSQAIITECAVWPGARVPRGACITRTVVAGIAPPIATEQTSPAPPDYSSNECEEKENSDLCLKP